MGHFLDVEFWSQPLLDTGGAAVFGIYQALEAHIEVNPQHLGSVARGKFSGLL